jgi:hypothetical protein
MGYTTDFSGSFQLNRPATVQEKNYLDNLSRTRRMKRDVEKLHEIYKGEHGNPFAKTREEIYGNEGGYFVGAGGHAGQDHDASIINYNSSPLNQPGLWLQWVLNEDGTQLEWDGGEKFYNYVEWLKYLIDDFFQPWGIKLNGEVEWVGEDCSDFGKIVVTDNKVNVLTGTIV